MSRPRVRIRYRKEHDLRLLGHHDLVRAWERLMRRADVRPAMSEGFHKRPRINFPSALAVGIAGTDEVVELELQEPTDPSGLQAALNAHAPEGLSITSIEPMPEGARFSQPFAAVYEVRLPPDRVGSVRTRVETLRRPVADGAAVATAAMPGTVRSLEIVDGVLRMELRLGEAGAVRPRDLLEMLDLSDLESQGAQIVRTRVELA